MRRKVARTLCVCALNELTRTSMRALPQTSAPPFIQQRSQKVSQFCVGQDLAGGVDPIWAHYDIAGKRERVNRDLGAPLTMEERCRSIHQEATVMSYPHSQIVHFFSGIISGPGGQIPSYKKASKKRDFFVTDPILESPWKNEVGE